MVCWCVTSNVSVIACMSVTPISITICFRTVKSCATCETAEHSPCVKSKSTHKYKVYTRLHTALIFA